MIMEKAASFKMYCLHFMPPFEDSSNELRNLFISSFITKIWITEIVSECAPHKIVSFMKIIFDYQLNLMVMIIHSLV